MAKANGTRTGKKIYLDGAPKAQDRKDLLLSYLKQINDRERAKMDARDEVIGEERMQAREVAKMIEKDKNEKLKEKLAKAAGMRDAIEAIKAERKAVEDDERHHMKNKTAFGSFPYTHGDTIEQRRAAANSELAGEYKDYVSHHSSHT